MKTFTFTINYRSGIQSTREGDSELDALEAELKDGGDTLMNYAVDEIWFEGMWDFAVGMGEYMTCYKLTRLEEPEE